MKVHIIGGGTFSHVRNHLALAAPAFGTTAKKIYRMMKDFSGQDVQLHLTKMADASSKLVTNADVSTLVDQLIADPETRAIIFNVAMCDYDGTIGDEISGSHANRLKTSNGTQVMTLTPADKVIGRIRRDRKDIFVVGFKTTTGATEQEQYQVALRLLKKNSINLVFANDTVTRKNFIVTPEESVYTSWCDNPLSRDAVLSRLVVMINSRMKLSFTRSRVVDAPPVPWTTGNVPTSLYKVVEHLINRGAYKPFMGKTVGHFAYKDSDGSIITSRRKSNFNELSSTGMVRIVPEGDTRVIAYGGKPSVGGQSQRIIFADHQDLDCIAHAHVPLKDSSRGIIPVAYQWPYECGSHECGKNTSDHLDEVEPGIWAVYLENHGPNVVFSKSVDPSRVIDFFDRHFDLTGKTGGLFDEKFQREEMK